MPRPSTGNVNEDVWPSINPAVPDDATYGYAAGIYVAALCLQAELIDGYVRDTNAGIGWSQFFDPATCPAEALPWLAQISGVSLTQGLAEADQRAMIQRRPGLNRCTLTALTEAAQSTLTGGRVVGVNERSGGDAYLLEVYTLTAETPDPTATLAAIMSQKPAGVKLQYDVVTGMTWDATSGTWGSSAAASATWDTADNNFTL